MTDKNIVFADDALPHTLTQTFLWPFRDVDVHKTFRWKIRSVFYDQRPGPDQKLATRIKYSASCTA